MTTRGWVYVVVGSVGVGVWVGSEFGVSFLSGLGMVGVGSVLYGVWCRRKIVSIIAVVICCGGIGLLRIHVAERGSEYRSMFDSKMELEGIIVEDIDIRTDKQLIAFRPYGHRQNMLITTTFAQHYFYGDRIVVSGKVAEPKVFDDFDYKKYLERFNVYAVVSYPKVLILKSHNGNAIKEYMLRIKYAFTGKISRMLPEPQSSLLLGILIGAKKTLPQNIIDDFNATGTSHVIAISGYNITIIVAALGFLAQFFGRRASFWISLMVIIFFVVVSGASASVVRAGIMGVLLLVSQNIGRQYRVAPALSIAGLIMVLVNPKILFWDIGFQLSFVATVGIIYIVPLIESHMKKDNDEFGIRGILVTTFAVIVSTLPLILLYFGRLSLVAPIVNILILPFIPLVMACGSLTILPWVGTGLAYVSAWLLTYILAVTGWFAHFTFSSITVSVPQWVVIVIIMLIGMLFWWLSILRSQRQSRQITVE